MHTESQLYFVLQAHSSAIQTSRRFSSVPSDLLDCFHACVKGFAIDVSDFSGRHNCIGSWCCQMGSHNPAFVWDETTAIIHAHSACIRLFVIGSPPCRCWRPRCSSGMWWCRDMPSYEGSVMGQILHGSAKTTHTIRAAIQRSKASLQELSEQYDPGDCLAPRAMSRGGNHASYHYFAAAQPEIHLCLRRHSAPAMQ